MSQLEAFLRGLTTFLVTGSAYLVTHSRWQSALAGLSAAFLAFGRKVWVELEPQWVKRIASWIDCEMADLVGRYERRYAKLLYYRHRTFDVKGFSTQGKFALELENVYVDLSVDPSTLAEIKSMSYRALPAATTGKRNILSWLEAGLSVGQHFAVVGSPGCGKTTLLKHLALILSSRNSPLRLTPILLLLRDHSKAIVENNNLTLEQIIELDLKELPPPSGWFSDRLARGKCLVMLDGLDEVANLEARRVVVSWLERQIGTANFGANRFVVTSRPNGYRDNPIAGLTLFACSYPSTASK